MFGLVRKSCGEGRWGGAGVASSVGEVRSGGGGGRGGE